MKSLRRRMEEQLEKEVEMALYYGGKSQRTHEQSRPDQGRICWCGNPECPGDAMGGFGAGSSGRVSALDDAIVRSLISKAMGAPDGFFGKPDEGSGPPASYTAARAEVEEWLSSDHREASLDEVYGQETAVAAIREAVEDPVLRKDLYERYGMKPPRGVLLSGPPGCGKTLMARAAVSAIRRVYDTKETECILVSGPAIQSPYVGVTEKTIRSIFAFAREYEKYRGHPLVVFLDEADAILPDRTGRVRRVAPWEESNVAQFLAEMDGIEGCGAFVMLATNRPEVIDEALLRDGRCDRKIKVGRPGREAAELILRGALKSAPLMEGTTIDELVMAGVESVFDPHRVLKEGLFVRGHIENGQPVVDSQRSVNLLMEHIVSGSMLVGLAGRSRNFAFRRDRDSGTLTGVGVMDVLSAVNEVFQENRDLPHSFAIEELKESLRAEGHEPLEPPPIGRTLQ